MLAHGQRRHDGTSLVLTNAVFVQCEMEINRLHQQAVGVEALKACLAQPWRSHHDGYWLKNKNGKRKLTDSETKSLQPSVVKLKLSIFTQILYIRTILRSHT